MQDRQLIIAPLTIIRSTVNMAYPEVVLTHLWVIGNFAAKSVIDKVLILYVSPLCLSSALAHLSILG